jgi:hypothetical protein
VKGNKTMVALKYVLMLVGAGVFGSTGALVVYDIYVSTQLRRLLRGKSGKAGSFFQRGVQRAAGKATGRTNLNHEIPFVQAKACAAAHH